MKTRTAFLAALAALAANAVQMATENWVSNRLTEATAPIRENVAALNSATQTLQSAVGSLADIGKNSTNYTNLAIINLSSTNSILSGGPYLKTSYEGATVGYSYSPGGETVFNSSGIYVVGYSYLTQVVIISEETNGPLSSIQQYGGRFITARQEMENYISTNNPAFVSAVIAAPLVGADPSDLSELAEYGSYGTVGAAILALIAGLGALKRRVGTAETALAQKADTADLPYRLVEPGKWETDADISLDLSEISGHYDDGWYYTIGVYFSQTFNSEAEANTALTLNFVDTSGMSGHSNFTATRPSLPGHLLDRAGNRVVVTGDMTLTLPEANPGYLRDFLVRLEISGSTVPTITFAAPTGETIVYETDGDEFPVPDDEGDWLYSFTETAAHRFAVSLKKVNEVLQGGS